MRVSLRSARGASALVPSLGVLTLALLLLNGCAGGDDASLDELDDPSVEVLMQEAASGTCARSGAPTADTPRVYVVGDSTASNYASNLAPRTGWAQTLQSFFAPACASVQNDALSGRSSKSFYDEGAFTKVRGALRKGDYVLIQFGHNDEKTDDKARGTQPFSTYQTYLSKYVDESLARGATPILLTPIQRNKWSNGKVSDSHGSYPEAMRQLATKKNVALVDATTLTKAYFEKIGQAATNKLFMNLARGESPNYPSGNQDDTHLQERGARVVAQIVLADLARQELALGSLVKAAVKAP